MKSSYRIKKNKDFDTCFKKGKKIYSSSYLIFFNYNKINHERIGISVSKKISKLAVVRNKIRRQIKSFFYTHKIQINKNIDLLIIVKEKFIKNNYLSNLNELEKILLEKKLIKKNNAKEFTNSNIARK